MKSNFIALSDWKQVRLEDISYDFVSGGTPSTSKIQYWGGDIHWMRSAHISGKEVFSGEKLITKNGLENSATNIVPKDNLLIATRVSLGNVVINRVDMAISQDLTGIILNKEKTDENFLYYLLKTKENEILSIAQGTTIKGILRDDLKKIRISLPPLNEQRGIVEVLGTVDECIRLTDVVIERAEELKRGLMLQLLTRGIGHTEYKETPLGEIPITWKIRKIKNICKLRKNKRDLPNEIAHIPMEKISEKEIFAEYEMVKKEKIKSGIYCEQGDILIAKITPSFENGKQAIVPVIPSICAIATTEVIPLIVKENINPYFIFYYLKQKHIRDIITSKMEGSTGRQRVPTDILLNHVMAVPPMDEQNKISQILLTIEEKIESESYKINYLLEIKQGLMQLLLSGKIRVELKGDGLHRIGDGRESNN